LEVPQPRYEDEKQDNDYDGKLSDACYLEFANLVLREHG
jgi:hypothetical protein